ncbi:MAG: Mbeg1-like protein [Aristaeellaceae bacterium]
MPNMMDYLTWRGDLSLQSAPFTPVDGLILASLSYNDLGPHAESGEGMLLRELAPLLPLRAQTGNQYFVQWRELLYAMADTVRFGGVRLHDYVNVVDDERNIQFSAVTADLPDGQVCVCFRGTDSSLVGWREDFTMAFESPVPAQMEALTYLERTALRTDHDLLVAGHSKGGNLASYAAAHAEPETQARLRGVYSFDGPGLDDATLESEGYGRIRGVLHAIIPQSSVVGLLLAHHPSYTVVRSTAVSLLQHDAFTWQLAGPHFEELGDVDAGSQLMDETLHEWLCQAPAGQRKVFVDTLFSLLEATGAATLNDLSADRLHSALAILSATREVDAETGRMIARLISSFVAIGMGNLLDAATRRPRQHLEQALHHHEHNAQEE